MKPLDEYGRLLAKTTSSQYRLNGLASTLEMIFPLLSTKAADEHLVNLAAVLDKIDDFYNNYNPVLAKLENSLREARKGE